jgi:hypothetical protein
VGQLIVTTGKDFTVVIVEKNMLKKNVLQQEKILYKKQLIGWLRNKFI